MNENIEIYDPCFFYSLIAYGYAMDAYEKSELKIGQEVSIKNLETEKEFHACVVSKQFDNISGETFTIFKNLVKP